MGRMPPREDEPAATRHTTYQAAHKRSPQINGRTFRSDEDPEVPRVRRASRVVETPVPYPSRSRRPQRSQRSQREEQEERDIDIPSSPPVGEEAHRIIVTQRRNSRIYEPPRRLRHKYRYARSPQRLLLRAIGRHFRLVLVGIGLALLLLLIPLAQNVLRLGRPASSPMPGVSVIQPVNPANPHQLLITPTTVDHPPPPVYASAAYLLDADSGATLYAHNPFMHLPMLSTTKLMTALVAVEEGENKLDQPITINNAIARDLGTLSPDSSVMGIKAGETYTLRELLYGALLASGNDACIAIADGLDGSVSKFVAKMNERALQLGLLDTHYINPHGLLDSGHYSSAHDLALLGKYSLGNPIIHTISATKNYTIPKTAQHPQHDMFNGNQILWWYPGVDSGKPGFDGRKNFNQVISVTRNNRHLIGVAMNTIDWWTDMRDLMNWGFDTFDWISPRDIDPIHPIPYDVDWRYFAKDQKENTVPVGDHARYYIYTGYSVADPILAYYDKNGGLQKFGYPRGMPVAQDRAALTQKFDHATISCDVGTQVCTNK